MEATAYDVNRMIAMTNHGARCMDVGDFQSAIECLTQALHFSKYSMRDDSSESRIIFDLSTLMVDGYQTMRTVADDHPESSSSSVYSSPIRIPEHVFQSPGLHTEVAISSILIFNLAIAHHVCSQKLQEEPLRHAFLTKATSLYELAVRLQEEDCARMRAPTQFSKLFILACLNNLGHAYRCLGQEESYQSCSQRLLSVLMCITTSSMCSKTSVCVDYSTFFRAISEGTKQTAAAA